jgi:hypothetical protein
MMDDHPKDPGQRDAADEPLEGEIVEETHQVRREFRQIPAGAHTVLGGPQPGRRPRRAPHRPRPRASLVVTAGLTLVTVGLVLLAGSLNDVVAAGGPALWIGAGLLMWWALRGTFALLLPASVLAGLGAGLVLAAVPAPGNPVAYGLAAGFLLVTVLALARHAVLVWWPLVPAAVLLVLGLVQDSPWAEVGGLGWPLFLIVVGLLVLGAALTRGRRR